MATVGAGAPAGAALQTANGAEAAIPGSSNEKSTAAPTSSPERSGKEAKPGLWARWMADLPPWLTDALHSRRAWKNFARSMIALFVALVIMVVRPCELSCCFSSDHSAGEDRPGHLLHPHRLHDAAPLDAAELVRLCDIHPRTGYAVRVGVGLRGMGECPARARQSTDPA